MTNTAKTTLKTAIFSLLALIASSTRLSARERVQGWCEQGNQTVSVPFQLPSTTTVQRSYSACTVTVYLTGTSTPATLYSNNTGTSQANPFTAQTTGYYSFYADNGRYDINFSGAGISAPFTTGDHLAFDPSAPGALAMNCTKDFLADPTYAADSTAAIQACGNAAVTNHVAMELTDGKFKITSLVAITSGTTSADQGFTMFGHGTHTVLQYSGTTAGLQIIGGSGGAFIDRIRLHDFSITSGCSPNCPFGIKLTTMEGLYADDIFIDASNNVGSGAPTLLKGLWLNNANQGHWNGGHISNALTDIYMDGFGPLEISGLTAYTPLNGTAVDQEGGNMWLHNNQFVTNVGGLIGHYIGFTGLGNVEDYNDHWEGFAVAAVKVGPTWQGTANIHGCEFYEGGGGGFVADVWVQGGSVRINDNAYMNHVQLDSGAVANYIINNRMLYGIVDNTTSQDLIQYGNSFGPFATLPLSIPARFNTMDLTNLDSSHNQVSPLLTLRSNLNLSQNATLGIYATGSQFAQIAMGASLTLDCASCPVIQSDVSNTFIEILANRGGTRLFRASGSGIQGTAFYTGTSANTDSAGTGTIGGGGFYIQGFSTPHVSVPICTATDITAVNPVRVRTLTTEVDVYGTIGDSVNYLCIGRN